MEFGVLGPLRVVLDGSQLAVGSRLQRILLLALLAAPGDSHSTDRLSDDLWGDSPPKNPVAGIHAYISHLRRALEPNRRRGSPSKLIVSRADGYAIELGSAQLDSKAFEQDVSRARTPGLASTDVITATAQALGRWRGEPFADADARPFTAAPTARLLTLRAEAERLAVSAQLEGGDLAAALTGAEQLVARYPLDEACHALVMRSLYRSGRQSDALGAYASIRRLLVTELGIEPGVELRELETRVLQHDPTLDEPRARRRVVGVPVPTPRFGDGQLIGRSTELDALLEIGTTARLSSRPHTVVVSGEAGIGKTRLVEEAADRFTEAGDVVAWIQCDRRTADTGLFPLAAALRGVLDDPTIRSGRPTDSTRGVEVAALADRLLDQDNRPGWPIDEGLEIGRYRWYDACHHLARHLCSLAPVVIVVDDVHRSGQVLFDALAYLGSRRDLARLSLIVTTRSGSSSSAESGRSLTRLSGSDLHRIALGGLDLSAVGEMAYTSLGGDGSNIAAELHRRTGGNPFFVNELLDAVDPDHPLESLAGPDGPRSIGEAVLARFDDLPPDLLELLGVASVAGPWFDPQRCADIADTQVPAVDLVDQAIEAGLVFEHPEHVGRCAFRHDLVRSSIAARLTKLRRSTVHAALGNALLHAYGLDDPEHIGEVAHHLNRGAPVGTGLAGARAGLLAAEVALDHHDGTEAARIARESLDSFAYLSVDEGDPALASELWRSMAAARKRVGDPVGAQDAARTALAVAREAGLTTQMAEAAVCFNGGPVTSPWLGYWSPPVEAVAILEEAHETLSDHDRRAEIGFKLLCALSEALSDNGDIVGADSTSRQVLGLAEEVDGPTWLPEALLQRWRVLDLSAVHESRPAVLDRAVRASATSPQHLTLALRATVVERIEQSDLAGAHMMIGRIRALADDTDSDVIKLEADIAAVAVDLAVGQLQKAEDEMGDVLSRYSHLDESRLSVVELQMARLLYERHALDTIETDLVARLAAHDTASWRAPLALLLSEHGRHDEAAAVLDDVRDRDFGRLHESLLQFLTPSLFAETVANLDDTRRAKPLADLLVPLADRMISFNIGQLLGGWVGLPAGRLLGTMGRLAEAEGLITAAWSQARRLGSDLLMLRAEAALLELDCRAGRRPRSSVSGARQQAASAGFMGVAHQLDRLG